MVFLCVAPSGFRWDGRGRFRAQTGRRLLARRTSQISSVSGIMSLPVAPERRYSTNSATRKAHAPARGVSFAGPGTEARDFQGPTGVGLGVNYLDRPAVSRHVHIFLSRITSSNYAVPSLSLTAKLGSKSSTSQPRRVLLCLQVHQDGPTQHTKLVRSCENVEEHDTIICY